MNYPCNSHDGFFTECCSLRFFRAFMIHHNVAVWNTNIACVFTAILQYLWISSTSQFVCLNNWLFLYFPWCIVLVLTTCISGVLCSKHCISLWYSFWRTSVLSTSESSTERHAGYKCAWVSCRPSGVSEDSRLQHQQLFSGSSCRVFTAAENCLRWGEWKPGI